MPKKYFTYIKLPHEKPDCCADCPLCGIVPKALKPKGSYETHLCLGTFEAMTQRSIKIHASKRDSHHPLKRPCDKKWDAWMQLNNRQFPLNNIYYLQCRVPYEQKRQLIIRFHN